MNAAAYPASPDEAQAGWRDLRLVRRVAEAQGIASFYLEPADGAPLAPFRAGQYLTLRIANGDRPVLRTYTISSAPSERDHYRLTVKHERRPTDREDVAHGAGSTHLHDVMKVGDTIRCLDPRGHFTLDDSKRPVVLIAGGVGVTPMLSMLAELAAAPDPRPVWLLHASRDKNHHAMREEAVSLAECHGRATTVFFHDEGDAPDTRQGRIDMDALRHLLPFNDYSFYLCGPPPFMKSLYRGLRDLNVARDRIAYEFFGPAAVMDETDDMEASHPDDCLQEAGAGSDGLTVTFVRSGIDVQFPEDGTSIMELARAQGIDMPSSCEEGVCGTCRCKLVSGEIDYATDPIAWREEGEILPCIARPISSIEVDI